LLVNVKPAALPSPSLSRALNNSLEATLEVIVMEPSASSVSVWLPTAPLPIV
jgi:hypothetical protein